MGLRKRGWMVCGLTVVIGGLLFIPHHLLRTATSQRPVPVPSQTRVMTGDVPRTPHADPEATGLGAAVRHMSQLLSNHASPVNVLLIANNARNAADPLSLGTAGGQADILMVAHIDQLGVTLISIPRDTLIAMPNWRVPIPKIKTAFTIGLQASPRKGPEYAMACVAKMTGLPIHQYIVTNFRGFIDAVNSVGGLTVNIPARIYDPAYSGADLRPGTRTLNGEQALAFVRVRQNQARNDYRINDYERQQAEMQVLATLKRQLLDSAANPVRMVKLVSVWEHDVATNLSNPELVSLGVRMTGAPIKSLVLGDEGDSLNLASAPLPGVNTDNHITGAYYDVVDPQEIKRALKPFGATTPQMGLPPLPPPSSVPVVVYGQKRLVSRLKSLGYSATYGGTAFSRRPCVYYPQGRIAWGWAVARSLQAANTWVATGERRDAVIVSA